MASVLGAIGAGVKGYSDVHAKDQAHGKNLELIKIRQEMDNEVEARIHERNRGEKLTDVASEREYQSGEKAKDRAGKADDKQMIKTIKQKDDLGIETDVLVRVNKDGTYTPLKSTDGEEPDMSFDDAKSQANALYDERASMMKSDEAQFGMSEQDIKDIWTQEILDVGHPVTGIKKAGKSMLDKSEPKKTKEKSAETIKVPAGTKDGVYKSGGKTVSVVNGIATVISG